MGFFSPESWSAKSLPVVERTIPQCGRCGLLPQCKSPNMAAAGRGRRKVLILTDAPGKRDDLLGKRTSGKHGSMLNRLFHNAAGYDVAEGKAYSALACRPPGDWIEEPMVLACRPNVMNLIRDFKPNVIISVGLYATKTVIAHEWGDDFGTFQRWVGHTIPSAKLNAWVCPTYDMRFVARQREEPAIVRLVTSHFRRAAALEDVPVGGLNVDRESAMVRIFENPEDTRRMLKLTAAMDGDTVSFDYETTGIKPDRVGHHIHTVSWCDNGTDTFSGVVDESCHDALRAVLRNPRLKKVAHNAKFEERWSIAKLNTKVRGWHWDTMLAAHCLDNREGITGLKFQSYVRFGIGDYASAIKGTYLEGSREPEVCKSNRVNKVADAPLDKLLTYGGLDAILTYKIMEIQKKEMGIVV